MQRISRKRPAILKIYAPCTKPSQAEYPLSSDVDSDESSFQRAGRRKSFRRFTRFRQESDRSGYGQRRPNMDAADNERAAELNRDFER